jgi:hypothetical protein
MSCSPSALLLLLPLLLGYAIAHDGVTEEGVHVDLQQAEVVVGGARRENPAFAKSLAHLRSENTRLEAELAALKAEAFTNVRRLPSCLSPLSPHHAPRLFACVQ